MKKIINTIIASILLFIALPVVAEVTIVNQSETEVKNNITTSAHTGSDEQSYSSVDIKTVVNGETVEDVRQTSQGTSRTFMEVKSEVNVTGDDVLASTTIKLNDTPEIILEKNINKKTIEPIIVQDILASNTILSASQAKINQSVSTTVEVEKPEKIVGLISALNWLVESIQKIFNNLFSLYL